MTKTQQFKALLTSERVEFLMEAHNGLSARIVEETGFKGIWASGLSISAAMGVRDNNEASWTQVLEVCEFMSDATDVPILLDGDGAALMKLGSMATVGFYQPKNLIHVILDNEQHDSTGGQQTSSGVVKFADVAAATNYRNAFSAEDEKDVGECLRELRKRPGPSLLHVKIKSGSPKELGRPTVKPHEVKERFMAFLNQGAA